MIIFIALPAFRDTVFPSSDGSFDFEDVWELICLAVAFFGSAIRVYTVGHVPEGTSGRNRSVQRADVLNTTGAYSLVRHPLYVGNFFIWLGISMFVRSWWLSLIFILLFVLFYERIIFAEEGYLRKEYGKAWGDWAARTPPFVPRFKNFKPAALPFSVRSVLTKEYHVLFNIILAFAVIEILEGLFTDHKFELDFAWMVAVAAGLAAWITLRVLKKKTNVLHVEGR